MKKSLSQHKRSGIYLASMPVVQTNLNQRLSDEIIESPSTKKMTPKRASQVVAVLKQVSKAK